MTSIPLQSFEMGFRLRFVLLVHGASLALCLFSAIKASNTLPCITTDDFDLEDKCRCNVEDDGLECAKLTSTKAFESIFDLDSIEISDSNIDDLDLKHFDAFKSLKVKNSKVNFDLFWPH